MIEVKERLILTPDGEITGSTGERLSQETPMDMVKLEKDLRQAYDGGIRSLAVSCVERRSFIGACVLCVCVCF